MSFLDLFPRDIYNLIGFLLSPNDFYTLSKHKSHDDTIWDTEYSYMFDDQTNKYSYDDIQTVNKEKIRFIETHVILNFLGPAYITGIGLAPKTDISKRDINYLHTSHIKSKYDSYNKEIIPSEFKILIQILKTENINIFGDAESLHEIFDVLEIFEMKIAKQISEIQVPYENVIIYYNKKFDEYCANDWYNCSSNLELHCCPIKSLPPLVKRKYIRIIAPMRGVKLSALKKGFPLNIDDILFATRVLSISFNYIYDEFYVLSSNRNTLTLEVKTNYVSYVNLSHEY